MLFLLLLWSVPVFAAFNLTWGSPAISLDSNPPIGDTDSNAYISMDPDGNAVAVWSRTTGNKASENIWASVYNHSLRTWTGAVKISGSGSATNSQAAVDLEGNAMFVWEEGFPTRIYYRSLSKDGIWTPNLSNPPAFIQPSKNAQEFPQVAIDGQGNALVIWTEFYGGIHHIFSAHMPKDGTWSHFGKISKGEQDARLIPSKALIRNKVGNGLAIWEENHREVHAARFMNDIWHEAELIADSGANSPSAGIDNESNMIIVWSQNSAIFSKKIENGLLSDVPLKISHPEYIAQRPFVGVDAKGNAVVVYERYNSMHKFIAASTLAKGSHIWTSPIDISEPSPSNSIAAGYPVFAMNSIGDGVAIWKEWTGTNMVIKGAGHSLGTWSSNRALSSFMGNAGSPQPAYDISITLNDAGNILAIWPEDPLKTGSQQIKTTAGVGLANLGPMPPVIEPTSIIEGIATGKQVLHKFPAHADLINILTWESPGNVSHFNIYRGNLSSLIATTSIARYEDHQRIPKQRETYLITAVDYFGHESVPITIVVHPR